MLNQLPIQRLKAIKYAVCTRVGFSMGMMRFVSYFFTLSCFSFNITVVLSWPFVVTPHQQLSGHVLLSNDLSRSQSVTLPGNSAADCEEKQQDTYDVCYWWNAGHKCVLQERQKTFCRCARQLIAGYHFSFMSVQVPSSLHGFLIHCKLMTSIARVSMTTAIDCIWSRFLVTLHKPTQGIVQHSQLADVCIARDIILCVLFHCRP